MAEAKETVKVEDVVEELEGVKLELEQIKSERDQYKDAYEQLVEQNANVWGLYFNTIDYVVAQTTRKQAK